MRIISTTRIISVVRKRTDDNVEKNPLGCDDCDDDVDDDDVLVVVYCVPEF